MATAAPAWHAPAMATPDTTGCEVRIEGAWRLLPLGEAHVRHRDADKRCPACHGRVRTQGTYSAAGGTVMMTHQRAHDGCPLMPRHYAGTPRPHPQPLGLDRPHHRTR